MYCSAVTVCARTCAYFFFWTCTSKGKLLLGVLMQRWVAVIMNWLTREAGNYYTSKLQLSHFAVLNGNKLIDKSGIQLNPLYTLCDYFGKDGRMDVLKKNPKKNPKKTKGNVIHYVCCNYWWQSALSFQNVIPHLFPKFRPSLRSRSSWLGLNK